MVRHQQFLARMESPRPQDGIDSGGGVGDEDEVLRVGADRRGQRLPRLVQERLHPPGQEPHRLRLHLPPQLRLPLEDRPGARPERPVIEQGDGRVQRPGVGGNRRNNVRERRGFHARACRIYPCQRGFHSLFSRCILTELLQIRRRALRAVPSPSGSDRPSVGARGEGKLGVPHGLGLQNHRRFSPHPNPLPEGEGTMNL